MVILYRVCGINIQDSSPHRFFLYIHILLFQQDLCAGITLEICLGWPPAVVLHHVQFSYYQVFLLFKNFAKLGSSSLVSREVVL